jgi:hypothetical protein
MTVYCNRCGAGPFESFGHVDEHYESEHVSSEEPVASAVEPGDMDLSNGPDLVADGGDRYRCTCGSEYGSRAAALRCCSEHARNNQPVAEVGEADYVN